MVGIRGYRGFTSAEIVAVDITISVAAVMPDDAVTGDGSHPGRTSGINRNSEKYLNVSHKITGVDTLTKSDKIFLALVLLMLIGKAVWTYGEVDHPIVQNWTGAWSAIIPAAFFGFIAIKLALKTGFPDIWDEKYRIKSGLCTQSSLVFLLP
ncbi:MAG: hypothetical protein JXA08_02935 [Methanomicrobiaceae archaeon]|nr:hypothetical protein [Methanomicrobiaceae archaeon]